MFKTIRRRPVPNDAHLPSELHPILQRVLAARQVKTASQLEYALRHLLPFTSLLGLTDAVLLLADTLAQQGRIMIVADYDADGATSCAVAYRALQMMGAQQLHYVVPNRETQGYGLTPLIVNQVQAWRPDLLLTVDNGIASVSGVAAAKAAGMRVLITDHHLPPPELPLADAIVNPNVNCDPFPSKHLAGVGVIFYVMLALRSHLREQHWFSQQQLAEPNLAHLLDLVALGTVADVVQLDYNNRILIEQGLRRIRADQCCPGIRALAKITQRDQTRLVTRDLAFALGPRLNAAGRMDDMTHGIQCLLSNDDASALEYASRLEHFNQERQYVEGEMLQTALAQLDRLALNSNDTHQLGVCLCDKTWHVGVIGLLASRLKERLHRPVIIFTQGEAAGYLKGSARSIQGVHIRDVLATIQAQESELIERFGGHAMAAGLTIPSAAFNRFQIAFDRVVSQSMSLADLDSAIESDGELGANDFNLTLAEALREIPWGQGFTEPVFDGEFALLEWRVLKDKHLKMVVQPVDSHIPLDAIAFNNRSDQTWDGIIKRVHLAYRLDVNWFRNARNLQLLVESIAPIT